MKIEKVNNFDLVRLIAASQVLIWHSAVHLNLFNPNSWVLKVVYNFPGVPIFFAISGFLITSSINKVNFTFLSYLKNRFLRLFPALLFCTLFTAFLLLHSEIGASLSDWGLYFLAQLSFLQPWVPNSFKSWGVGHPNGSLWSISVEIQLYLALPILILFLKNKGIFIKNCVLILVFSISVLYSILLSSLTNPSLPWIHQIGSLFILEHMSFFIIGIAFYYHYNFLIHHIENRFLSWLLVYIVYVLFFKYAFSLYENPYSRSLFGILANILVVFVFFSLAFSYKTWSSRFLRNNDISYGLYIFHMPIVNFFVQNGYVGDISYFLVVCLLSIFFALASWFLVERNALKFKEK
ncbi:MAG: acyltransferase family protein [Spirosomataceae bacterium]